ncbi:MAG: hypothetical protein JEZ04_19355 [Spirochaetales bacterium]|nr:hypothetical protein [Spirochaetales bacterium]
MNEISGYWAFSCNPERWEIDTDLNNKIEYDTLTIRNSDKDKIHAGHMGVIRVGNDNRTKKYLNEKQRLLPGVYAIVEVITEPELMEEPILEYWQSKGNTVQKRFRVKVKISRNLITCPILITQEDFWDSNDDSLLIKGFQGSTFPISSYSFDKIYSYSKQADFFLIMNY